MNDNTDEIDLIELLKTVWRGKKNNNSCFVCFCCNWCWSSSSIASCL